MTAVETAEEIAAETVAEEDVGAVGADAVVEAAGAAAATADGIMDRVGAIYLLPNMLRRRVNAIHAALTAAA